MAADDIDLDELLQDLKDGYREALEDGVRHGLGLAIAALEHAASLDDPPTLAVVAAKLRTMSGAFTL